MIMSTTETTRQREKKGGENDSRARFLSLTEFQRRLIDDFSNLKQCPSPPTREMKIITRSASNDSPFDPGLLVCLVCVKYS